MDYQDKTKRKQVLGSISGWDRLTTAEPEDSTHIPSNDHEYTLPDLYLELKGLINRLDPNQIEYLIKLISEHINDKNNPHQDTLEKMGTSVIKELYNLWIETGHIGDEDTFLKQLFQYVRIADLETTLKGEALDQVPSVYTAAKLVEKHNTDMDAHANLLEAIFPGSPLPGYPTYAVHASVGIPDVIEVKRTGKQYVVNPYGIFVECPENTLLPDYTFGEPAYPIFGAYSNAITYSEDFSKSVWTKTNCTIEKSSAVTSPRVENDFAYFMKETQDTTTKVHRLTYTASFVTDKVYTFSVYVYPVNRNAFRLNVHDNIAGTYSEAGFDLEDELIFLNDQRETDRVYAGMSKLPSGWFRLWLTFKSKATRDDTLDLILADIYDGDQSYIGNGLSGACLFGAQLSEGSMVPPYLYTNGSAVSCGTTSVRLPLDSSWYNPKASTIVMETNNITPLVQLATHELYTFGDGATSIAINARFPTSHKGRPYFVSHGTNNTAMKSRWGVATDKERIIVGQSYNDSEMSYVFTGGEPVSDKLTSVINQNSKYLYIGCDRYLNNPMNGYLFRFEYYPFKCTLDNLKYFLGD